MVTDVGQHLQELVRHRAALEADLHRLGTAEQQARGDRAQGFHLPTIMAASASVAAAARHAVGERALVGGEHAPPRPANMPDSSTPA
jgi:hypothetical protein